MTGTSVIMGDDRSPPVHLFQMSGYGHSVPVGVFREAMRKAHLYTASRCVTPRPSSRRPCTPRARQWACEFEERLARWVLMAHDRMGKEPLPFTHEFLALMLGVRRADVTVALNALEKKRG